MSNKFACEYDDIYLINGARTPFGKFMGALGAISPTDLGIIASRAAIKRSGITPEDIDHVVYANIIQSSFDAIYIPRHVGLYCGIPSSVPALLVQRICGSGFESIISAAEQITLGKAGFILAGGAENMTLTPTASFGNRMGYRLGGIKFGDTLMEGLYDPAGNCSMGQTAENLAKKYKISREDVDEFALRSHTLALKNMKDGTLGEEIVEVGSGVLESENLTPRKIRTIPSKRTLNYDENIRETGMDQLKGLSPTFAKDGVQTAGNSSGIVDGAASVIVGSGKKIELKGLQPLAKIVASASAGVDPTIMGIGPAPAIRNVLEKTGLSLDDFDLFEINEAFAVVLLAAQKLLTIDLEKVNVNGGAVAIGHPIGASGARLLTTLLYAMEQREASTGLVTLCIGGGEAAAVIVERV